MRVIGALMEGLCRLLTLVVCAVLATILGMIVVGESG